MAVHDPITRRNAEATISADAVEFAALLNATFRNLKSSGQPPPVLRAAVARAGLAKRHRPALLTLASTGPISVSALARRLGLLRLRAAARAGDPRPAPP